jgi:hypothetical protein
MFALVDGHYDDFLVGGNSDVYYTPVMAPKRALDLVDRGTTGSRGASSYARGLLRQKPNEVGLNSGK